MLYNKCREKYGIVDSSVYLCVGVGYVVVLGGCNGDSGGLFVCEMVGKWYLYGVVSFGKWNCLIMYYIVFIWIISYRFWIL